MSQARKARERVCLSIAQKNLLKENKTVGSGSRRKARDVKVLAERNPAVAPVGVWVESGEECQEHPAVRTHTLTCTVILTTTYINVMILSSKKRIFYPLHLNPILIGNNLHFYDFKVQSV